MIRCLMIGTFLSAQTALAGGLAVVDFNKAGSLVREGAKMQAELEELKADRGQRLKEIAHIQRIRECQLYGLSLIVSTFLSVMIAIFQYISSRIPGYDETD